MKSSECALPRPEKDDVENPNGQPDCVSARGQVDEDAGAAAGRDGVEEAVPDAGDLGEVLTKEHEGLEGNTIDTCYPVDDIVDILSVLLCASRDLM